MVYLKYCKLQSEHSIQLPSPVSNFFTGTKLLPKSTAAMAQAANPNAKWFPFCPDVWFELLYIRTINEAWSQEWTAVTLGLFQSSVTTYISQGKWCIIGSAQCKGKQHKCYLPTRFDTSPMLQRFQVTLHHYTTFLSSKDSQDRSLHLSHQNGSEKQLFPVSFWMEY